VAAEQTLAAQVGAAILARGGNAVDAAVATNAAMGLMAPMANGIGGDLFAIVYEAKTNRYHGLNASGWAPAGLSIDLVRRGGVNEMIAAGVHRVTVPGAVDGWRKLLAKFGRLDLATVLAPAIRHAEEGFPVSEIFHRNWKYAEKTLRADPNAAKLFLPGDRAPAVGEIFRNPDLAWAYRQIAAKGADAYYKGEIGRRIVGHLRALGGTMTIDDLASFSSEWVEPISIDYRGWTVYELPPNGQGMAALGMLNIMEQFPIAKLGQNTAETIHRIIEAKKLAYADLSRYVADPRFGDIPVTGMLSKGYARKRAQLIDPARASEGVEPGHPMPVGKDTTYLCVVDEAGNMVSLIQSNFASFGAALVAAGTGFALQNRGELFSLESGHPNALAGRKRPFHTIIPAFMSRQDVRIAFGIMGGFNQAQAHAQFVSNVVDHGFNIQQALEAARVTKLTFPGRDVMVEEGVPEAVRRKLGAKGHEIEVLGSFSGMVGGGQAVMRDLKAAVNYGASDPRKDGSAVPAGLSETTVRRKAR
jgi:gamma-glutamyltranspeptidase/glutathione hydrolase